MRVKTADLMDRFEQQVQVMDPVFVSYGGADSFYGKVVCVRVFDDNVLVRQTLETNGKGCVLVVDGGHCLECGRCEEACPEDAIEAAKGI
jgi:regulator of ribonuclease activity A